MGRFNGLTNAQWQVIEYLLPREPEKRAWFKKSQEWVTQDDQNSAHFQASFSHECDLRLNHAEKRGNTNRKK